MLFFFLASLFSPVTCSCPALGGIVSPKSVFALTQILVALLLTMSTPCTTSLGFGVPHYPAQQAPCSADDGATQRGLLSCVPSTSLVGGLAQVALLCSLKAPLSAVFPSKLASTGLSQHTCYLCPWASLPPSCPPSFTHRGHCPRPRTHGGAGPPPLGVLRM